MEDVDDGPHVGVDPVADAQQHDVVTAAPAAAPADPTTPTTPATEAAPAAPAAAAAAVQDSPAPAQAALPAAEVLITLPPLYFNKVR